METSKKHDKQKKNIEQKHIESLVGKTFQKVNDFLKGGIK